MSWLFSLLSVWDVRECRILKTNCKKDKCRGAQMVTQTIQNLLPNLSQAITTKSWDFDVIIHVSSHSYTTYKWKNLSLLKCYSPPQNSTFWIDSGFILVLLLNIKRFCIHYINLTIPSAIPTPVLNCLNFLVTSNCKCVCVLISSKN